MSDHTYHVQFYYLATGMEGIPTTRDHGSISASSEEEAIDTVISRQYTDMSERDQQFIRGCLSAKLIGTALSAPPEQVAADERDAAIKGMVGRFALHNRPDVPWYELFQQMYDAGYRMTAEDER